MPTYEYGCAACGSEWEEIQRITEPPLEVCPKCGKSAAHRLISAGGGFILKGGGWYSDLYSSAKPAGNKEESKSATSTDATAKDAPAKAESAPAKAETKTETKAATSPSTPAPAASSSSSSSS
ncbi:MAG TPA: zinc ribbon domain-containing protein [Polyangiaceae bacterium]|jgi:putative FmdB family regulatory protein